MAISANSRSSCACIAAVPARTTTRSSGSDRRKDATDLLRRREGDSARGLPVTPKVGRVTFEEAAADLLNDDRANGKRSLNTTEPKIALLRASVVIGSLLADGIGDAILIRGESGAGQSLRLAYNILQAAGCRSFKTDYVACPSCGRTLFNLQTVTARIKARTDHLKGVKIAIMGCIVNGPGEMADADFGYVGGAPGKINLYVGKTPIKFNIPEAEAVERLVDLIRENGKWVEPELKEAALQH